MGEGRGGIKGDGGVTLQNFTRWLECDRPNKKTKFTRIKFVTGLFHQADLHFSQSRKLRNIHQSISSASCT